MKADINKMYIVEGDTVAFLERLATRLYAEKPLSGDERRNWANDLFNIHLRRFIEYDK